ncbi:unnamed protein product [Ascophyllum nodosum]
MARRTGDDGVEECKGFSPSNDHTTSTSSTPLPLGSWNLNIRHNAHGVSKVGWYGQKTGKVRPANGTTAPARCSPKRMPGGSFRQHLGGASPATAANAAVEEAARMAAWARRARQLLAANAAAEEAARMAARARRARQLLANRERRRAAGQLAAQENARYKDSFLRAFDPVRPLHLESWVQRDMQKGFTDELQRLRPGRCQFLPRGSPNIAHAFREAFQNR